MPGIRRFSFLALFVLLGAAPAAAQVYVNLDARVHVVGGTIDQPLAIVLPPGDWVVFPIGAVPDGAYDAFSPWDANANCTPSCVPGESNRGWMHRYGIRIGGTVVVDPATTWNGLAYADPIDALRASTITGFQLLDYTTVEFYIPTEEPLGDNRGGISLFLTIPLESRAGSWGRIKRLYR